MDTLEIRVADTISVTDVCRPVRRYVRIVVQDVVWVQPVPLVFTGVWVSTTGPPTVRPFSSSRPQRLRGTFTVQPFSIQGDVWR